ncbi:hypothetical protein GPECTOR_95g693 [Gonium pectorale]|uniref:Uncharacterized protein n=1 Tax=Gonium pectorale TaxID=33097 RepID=A0A150G0D5_GONPE|nr:hypothetical protein GPECTOR_95g693 [Gonium pectorale]|eukprot:KXZ43304.1 hypothetical protein GPECTOR_95g693 [Gonium pectorale]
MREEVAYAAAGVLPPKAVAVAGSGGAAAATTAAATAAFLSHWELLGGGPSASTAAAAAHSSPAGARQPSPPPPPPRRLEFPGLDANQLLDLAVALADLYVYPGDEWMAAHEARMAALGGGPGGGGLTAYQWRLLAAAYGALEDTWEGYAQPKAGEVY